VAEDQDFISVRQWKCANPDVSVWDRVFRPTEAEEPLSITKSSVLAQFPDMRDNGRLPVSFLSEIVNKRRLDPGRSTKVHQTIRQGVETVSRSGRVSKPRGRLDL